MKNTLLLGTRKGLIVLEKSGQEWQQSGVHFLGARVPYACADPRTGTWWALLDHGHWGEKLHRSRDRGANWEEVAAPTFPEGALIKEGVEAKVHYLWVLQPGLEIQPGRLYLGTVPGGLFQSDDDGDSWALVEGLWNHPSRMEGWFGGGFDYPGVHSVVPDPRNPDHLMVGISVAGVFETWDGGLTWAPKNKGLKADFMPDPDIEVGQDPHLLVAAPSNPDVLWQQNHCGIFVSEDGANSWSDVSEPEGPAKFGFGISVSETDPLTAWVIPGISDELRVATGGGLIVSRTTDGGKSWQSLTNGLPEANCFDLVFRHAMDLTGTRLAFGSTTGNVFLSENNGDRFACLGNYFPPVFSVRFAE